MRWLITIFRVMYSVIILVLVWLVVLAYSLSKANRTHIAQLLVQDNSPSLQQICNERSDEESIKRKIALYESTQWLWFIHKELYSYSSDKRNNCIYEIQLYNSEKKQLTYVVFNATRKIVELTCIINDGEINQECQKKKSNYIDLHWWMFPMPFSSHWG